MADLSRVLSSPEQVAIHLEILAVGNVPLSPGERHNLAVSAKLVRQQAADLDQLRQRVGEVEAERDKASQFASDALIDLRKTVAKLALAERENVQLRVAISEAAGLLRGFIKIVERHDAAIASQ